MLLFPIFLKLVTMGRYIENLQFAFFILQFFIVFQNYTIFWIWPYSKKFLDILFEDFTWRVGCTVEKSITKVKLVIVYQQKDFQQRFCNVGTPKNVLFGLHLGFRFFWKVYIICHEATLSSISCKSWNKYFQGRINFNRIPGNNHCLKLIFLWMDLNDNILCSKVLSVFQRFLGNS